MDYKETYKLWKNHLEGTDDYGELIKYESDDALMQDAFYRYLEFGTAGMRGVLGLGTNRMNVYTVRRSTQGLANYIKKIGREKEGVCIAYDSRINSDVFARETALVLCANGITAYLYDKLTSVPQLSFSVLELGCAAGVVITASHNPAKYNGYKVYGADGGQLSGEDAEIVMGYINDIKDIFSVKACTEEEAGSLLKYVGHELNEKYYKKVESLCVHPDIIRSEAQKLNIVYTPLHGTGNIPVSRVLSDLGVAKLHIVAEQQLPDGRFPTVSAPNPENPDAFKLAIALANEREANLILATDPDCDRLGVAVRDGSGAFTVLTGNQIGCLLLDYLLAAYQPGFTGREFVVKSIVSTPMADVVAARYGVEMRSVLTGFKYIAGQIKLSLETDRRFLFGFEESYGFLSGTFVRDKDACIAAMLVAEAACHYCAQGMTLYDAVCALYKKYGYYEEKVISITREGITGIQKIKDAVLALREGDMTDIAGFRVTAVRDYLTGFRTELGSNKKEKLSLPVSDVLFYELENGHFIVRPSGTEPKLKAYISVHDENQKNAMNMFDKLYNGVTALLDNLIN